MNKKTIFISFLVIIIVIGAIYIYYTTNSSTAHVNNIKENVSEIIKLQNEITAENKKENKNELTITSNGK